MDVEGSSGFLVGGSIYLADLEGMLGFTLNTGVVLLLFFGGSMSPSDSLSDRLTYFGVMGFFLLGGVGGKGVSLSEMVGAATSPFERVTWLGLGLLGILLLVLCTLMGVGI